METKHSTLDTSSQADGTIKVVLVAETSHFRDQETITMGEKEALIGTVGGSFILLEQVAEGPISESLHDALKKFFIKGRLASRVSFPFLNGELLLSVHDSQFVGYRQATFTLITNERIDLTFLQDIPKHLENSLKATFISIWPIGRLQGHEADRPDYNRFEVEDVTSDYESLISSLEKAGPEGLRALDAFAIGAQTNNSVMDCLICSLLRQKTIKYEDGRLFLTR